MMNHNTKFLKARILLAMFSLLIGFSVATPICVQASDYDIEWIGGTDNGSFDDLMLCCNLWIFDCGISECQQAKRTYIPHHIYYGWSHINFWSNWNCWNV